MSLKPNDRLGIAIQDGQIKYCYSTYNNKYKRYNNIAFEEASTDVIKLINEIYKKLDKNKMIYCLQLEQQPSCNKPNNSDLFNSLNKYGYHFEPSENLFIINKNIIKPTSNKMSVEQIHNNIKNEQPRCLIRLHFAKEHQEENNTTTKNTCQNH